MNIITADTLPNNMRIKEIHGIIETTYPIEISKKGFIRGLVERNKNEHQEAYDNFVNSAKELGNGNTIYGVKISTAIGSFSNGIFLYITYYGTIATTEIIE
ncbi:hypothetical protein B5S43_12665 [Gilliamella apicola]|uniref:hypothetical protein n=1 Tax=Gilliamella apicola TaxID=1196095 RepID=UPI000B659A1A|nr:hypothetical protein [Gilliamella apicola]OTP90576.1 hypothetical protein B5S43_12665 [Gilliamella apicola]OTQ25594.1 hypothetical protein B6D22_01865 [Gilliamella apicola]